MMTNEYDDMVDGKPVLGGLTNIRALTEEESAECEEALKEALGDDYGKEYWERSGIEDNSFEYVLAVVEGYLEDMASQHVEPSISWAPLSDSRWELVGFHPEYGSAVIDSVYATPEVAKRIVAFCPEVGVMNLSR